MKRNLQTYMRLFNIADRLMKRYDPCNGCKGCALFPKPFDCCVGCPFNGPTGCVTHSIACKLWLCDSLPRKGKVKGARLMRHQIRRLQRIADALNFHYARSTPFEVLLLSGKHSVWFFYHKLNRGANQ